jgi:hypothetical protein
MADLLTECEATFGPYRSVVVVEPYLHRLFGFVKGKMKKNVLTRKL